ncbi:hypothetical protein B0H19DRAFT_1382599 [Mycena capillaripes]|nr:hypothetical protein B0H19DRAFT_1382599 [Mycena capillaripes]
MHRLSRIFHTQRRLVPCLLSTNTSARDLLPMELWELVFESLLDEDLLVAARVCSAWNDRCVRMFLLRSGFSRLESTTGLILDSHELPALQLSLIPLPLRTLACRPWGSVLMRDLRCIQDFVSRSRDIEQLNLTFCCNFTRIHVAHGLSCSAMRAEFCDVLRAMAQKTSGPLIMISNSEIYLVDHQDLAKWWPRQREYRSLSNLQRLPLIKKVRTVLTRRTPRSDFSLLVGQRGKKQAFVCLSSVHTVEMRSVHPGSSPQVLPPFTLLTFDEKTQYKLVIGWHSSADPWISSERLNTVLPYVHLPALETIRIGVVLDPMAFTQFLAAHDRIREIQLERGAPAHVPRADEMLTSAPVALPNLTRVLCTAAADLALLLNSVHPPPNLTGVTIDFACATPSDALAFKRALRRLSLHTGDVVLCLDLRTSACTGPGWPDSDDRLIASVLYCVGRLCIEFSAEDDVRSLLPWAACLSRLRSLHMVCRKTIRQTSSLLQEAKEALPWVSEVQLQELW